MSDTPSLRPGQPSLGNRPDNDYSSEDALRSLSLFEAATNLERTSCAACQPSSAALPTLPSTGALQTPRSEHRRLSASAQAAFESGPHRVRSTSTVPPVPSPVHRADNVLWTLPNNQHRHTSPMKDPFAHAAQNQAPDLAQAAAPHHDQVGLVLARLVQDRHGGLAFGEGPRDPDAGCVKGALCFVEDGLAGMLQALFQHRQASAGLRQVPERYRRDVTDVD